MSYPGVKITSGMFPSYVQLDCTNTMICPAQFFGVDFLLGTCATESPGLASIMFSFSAVIIYSFGWTERELQSADG